MSENNSKSVFETLSAVNVNDHIKGKNGLSYLPWAWAWGTLMPMDGKRLETDKKSAESEKPGTKPFVRKEATYREKAIAMQKEMNISNADMMRVYGANKNTTDEEWELIYKKLEANKRLNEEDGIVDSE